MQLKYFTGLSKKTPGVFKGIVIVISNTHFKPDQALQPFIDKISDMGRGSIQLAAEQFDPALQPLFFAGAGMAEIYRRKCFQGMTNGMVNLPNLGTAVIRDRATRQLEMLTNALVQSSTLVWPILPGYVLTGFVTSFDIPPDRSPANAARLLNGFVDAIRKITATIWPDGTVAFNEAPRAASNHLYEFLELNGWAFLPSLARAAAKTPAMVKPWRLIYNALSAEARFRLPIPDGVPGDPPASKARRSSNELQLQRRSPQHQQLPISGDGVDPTKSCDVLLDVPEFDNFFDIRRPDGEQPPLNLTWFTTCPEESPDIDYSAIAEENVLYGIAQQLQWGGAADSRREYGQAIKEAINPRVKPFSEESELQDRVLKGHECNRVICEDYTISGQDQTRGSAAWVCNDVSSIFSAIS